MKRIFVLAVGAMTMFSCAKENTSSQDAGQKALAMSISMSDAKSANQSSRAIVDTEATPGDLGVLLMQVYDATNAQIGADVALTGTQLAAVLNSSTAVDATDRIVVETISNTASYVRILGYYDAAATWEALTAIDAKDVNAIQGYDFNKVPFVSNATGGKDNINKTVGMGSGNHATHKVWTVEATIKPYFARIEVKGTPKTDTSIAGITVKNVYMNALNKTKDAVGVTTYEGNHAVWEYDGDGNIIGSKVPGGTDAGGWNPDYASNFGSMSNVAPVDPKLSAFNLWPATERPHVILEVEVDPGNGKPKYTGYITIVDLTGGNATDIQAGKIYNVNLADLEIKISDITPDPESKKADLYAKVTVENWTKVTLTPGL